MQESDSRQILFILIIKIHRLLDHFKLTFHTTFEEYYLFCASFNTKCMRIEGVWFHTCYSSVRFFIESAAG